ncbi:hypothetical protein I4U23_003872 [Adineta vaga]|nr:hypothetical protein I4U23_003872 [Adineta vaga]
MMYLQDEPYQLTPNTTDKMNHQRIAPYLVHTHFKTDIKLWKQYSFKNSIFSVLCGGKKDLNTENDETDCEEWLCENIRDNQLCNGQSDCSNNEDERLCNEFSSELGRTFIQYGSQSLSIPNSGMSIKCFKPDHPKLYSFPAINPIFYPLAKRKQDKELYTKTIYQIDVHSHCHRGIDILMVSSTHKNFFEHVCFCSPNYYGNRCQYQADRVSLTLTGDHRYGNQQAMNETFILSANIVSQDLDNNGNYWCRIKCFIRDLAKQFDFVHIITGPLFISIERKQSVNMSAGCFVVPNQSIDRNHPLTDFSVSIKDIERRSGLRLFHQKIHLDDIPFLCNRTSCELTELTINKQIDKWLNAAYTNKLSELDSLISIK